LVHSVTSCESDFFLFGRSHWLKGQRSMWAHKTMFCIVTITEKFIFWQFQDKIRWFLFHSIYSSFELSNIVFEELWDIKKSVNLFGWFLKTTHTHTNTHTLKHTHTLYMCKRHHNARLTFSNHDKWSTKLPTALLLVFKATQGPIGEEVGPNKKQNGFMITDTLQW